MPTQKPRLSITVEPDTFALVQRLSDLGGGSVASIIREIIETAQPVLEHMIKAAEAYQAAESGKQAEILAALEGAEARILPDATRLQAETLEAFRKAAAQE